MGSADDLQHIVDDYDLYLTSDFAQCKAITLHLTDVCEKLMHELARDALPPLLDLISIVVSRNLYKCHLDTLCDLLNGAIDININILLLVDVRVTVEFMSPTSIRVNFFGDPFRPERLSTEKKAHIQGIHALIQGGPLPVDLLKHVLAPLLM